MAPAESWDLDDDFLLPTGPLSLSAQPSDSEGGPANTSLSSSTGGPRSHDAFDEEDEMDWAAEFDEGQGRIGARSRGFPGLRKGSLLEEDGDDEGENAPLPPPFQARGYDDGESSIDLDDLDSSFSSTSSSEKQTTLKASKLPSGDTASHHAGINAAVLAVLASGAKGTVTKLQPSRRVLSPKQAAIDWDEDIEMPDGGLKETTMTSVTERRRSGEGADEEDGGTLRLKPKASYASSLGDDLFDDDEDVTKTLHASTPPFGSRIFSSPSRPTPSIPHHGPSPEQLRIRRSNPEPIPEDCTDDFDLPTTLSRVTLAPMHSRPHSMVSLTGSTDEIPDEDEDDSMTLHRPSRPLPSKPAAAKVGGFPSTAHTSPASSRFRSNSALSRPSLTPSLTTDRSSSPFTEPDFDEDEAFFEDLELPPIFGLPRKGSIAGQQSKGTLQMASIRQLPPKQTVNGKSDLQQWLEDRLKARSEAIEAGASPTTQDFPAKPPLSSASTTSSSSSSLPRPTMPSSVGLKNLAKGSKIPRRKMTGYEDKGDEKMEEGLEIHPESLRIDRLRSRSRASSLASISSVARPGAGAAGRRPLTGTAGVKKALPFPSANAATAKGPIEVRQTRSSLLRTESATQLELATPLATPRPRPVMTTTATGATKRTNASVHSRPVSMAFGPGREKPASPPPLRHRTSSLRPSPSSSSLASLRNASTSSGRGSGTRSPVSGRTSRVGPSRPATAAGFRTASTAHLAPPTVLGSKRSSGNLRAAAAATVSPPSSVSTAAPPSPRRSLMRKQSMPMMTASSMSAAATGKTLRSSLPSRDRSDSHPEAPRLAVPSYAAPTTSSIRHKAGQTSNPADTLPRRLVKRNFDETSAVPPLPRASSSRLTMPTISTRMKAKPSIIHEDGFQAGRPPACGSTDSSHRAHTLANVAVPQHLRRPKRQRQYGDGTELDAFDDLPTSKEKERKYTVKPTSATKPSIEVKPATPASTPLAKPMEQAKARLIARKAEQSKKRERDAAKRGATKKGLITKMSIAAFPKGMNTGEMRWNPLERRWEGNDHEARVFESTLVSSSRPALITNPSYQSPGARGGSKAQAHVVGNMVFDPVAMCWHSRSPGEEDDIDFGEEDGEDLSGDAKMVDATSGSAEGRASVSGGSRDLRARASWTNDFVVSEDGSLEIPSGDVEGVEEAQAFWKECVGAESRHREEVRAWVKSDEQAVDRSYLQEIRRLVMEQ